MKLFSIFNKPFTKINNKQSGVIFLQWAIIVFIAGFAMICVVWWFFYVLQGKVIVVKGEIEQMRDTIMERPTCKLPHPGVEQEANGNEQIGPYEFFADGTTFNEIPETIPYPNQSVVICNLAEGGGNDIFGLVEFYDDVGIIHLAPFGSFPDPPLAPGACTDPISYSHSGDEPFTIKVGAAGNEFYSVTITPTP